MTQPKYRLQAQAEVITSMGEFQIDWHKIMQQVKEAQQLVDANKLQEPEMKKKNGKKKKGY
jgi:hypothetical protein